MLKQVYEIDKLGYLKEIFRCLEVENKTKRGVLIATNNFKFRPDR